MTLYLKYRPQTIEELDLTSVRVTLKKIIASGNIPHGFLFSGPKGTGKTSSARILAKLINCEKNPPAGGEPCNQCVQCLSITKGSNIDVIELDGASNRGIDDVRNLKENIILAPSLAKKKIYIIDEAHMLTLEASNALLRTLEEPPAHVVFILATTNPEKLPGTVRSRLTNINFTKATKEEIERQLTRVAKGEKVKIDNDAMEAISKAADGSFRDAVKILENLIWETRDINKKAAEKFLTKFKNNSVGEFLEIISQKDTKRAIVLVEKIVNEGRSVKAFIDELIAKLHFNLLGKIGINNDELVNFTKEDLIMLIELFTKARSDTGVSPIPEVPVEIAIIKWCGGGKKNPHSAEASRGKERIEREVVSEEVWKKLLDIIKNKNTSIEALLRATKPMGMEGKTIIIGVYYQFHKERLENIQNKKVIEEVFCRLMGSTGLKVSYELTEKTGPSVAKALEGKDILTNTQDKDIIDAAKEIFG